MDANGLITAVGNGTAYVTANAINNGTVVARNITVVKVTGGPFPDTPSERGTRPHVRTINDVLR